VLAAILNNVEPLLISVDLTQHVLVLRSSAPVAGTLSTAKAGSIEALGLYLGIALRVKCHCLAAVFGLTWKVSLTALKLPRGRIL
jgi:hypothetical protein